MFLDHRFLSSETIKLYKGASSDTGFAAVFHKMWVAGKWHRSFSSADITLPELYPLVLATKWFGWYLSNNSIIFMTDTSGVFENVVKLSSRNQQSVLLSPARHQLMQSQRLGQLLVTGLPGQVRLERWPGQVQVMRQQLPSQWQMLPQRQRWQNWRGRLLPIHTAGNVTPVHVVDMTGNFCHAAETSYHPSDLDSDAANEMLNLLGGVNVNRTEKRILKGNDINLQVLISDQNVDEKEQK